MRTHSLSEFLVEPSIAMLEVTCDSPGENIKQVENFLKFGEYPKWLDENFIQKILRKFHLDAKLEVKSFKVQRCGFKGEGYALAVHRVHANFFSGKKLDEIQSRSLIVKVLSSTPIEAVADIQKEIEMYENVLPEFRRLLESINEPGDFYPTVLEVDKHFNVIVMEDLDKRNFIKSDRLKDLDLKHVTMTLQKLAGMHAASAVVLADDPRAFDHIDVGIFTRNFENFHQFSLLMFDACVDEISTWHGFEFYSEKLRELRTTFIERTLNAFDREDGDFLVLNHGDLCVNNLMFKSDGAGSLSDVVLIDFQFSFVGSPALDLIVRHSRYLFDIETIFFLDSIS